MAHLRRHEDLRGVPHLRPFAPLGAGGVGPPQLHAVALGVQSGTGSEALCQGYAKGLALVVVASRRTPKVFGRASGGDNGVSADQFGSNSMDDNLHHGGVLCAVLCAGKLHKNRDDCGSHLMACYTQVFALLGR